MRIWIIALCVLTFVSTAFADPKEVFIAGAYSNGGTAIDDYLSGSVHVQVLWGTGDVTGVLLDDELVLSGTLTINGGGDYVLSGYDSKYGNIELLLAEGFSSNDIVVHVSVPDYDLPVERWNFRSDGDFNSLPRVCVCFSLTQGTLTTVTCTSAQCYTGVACAWNGEIASAYCEWR